MNPLFFIPFDINDIPVVKQKFYKVKPMAKAPKYKSVQIAKRYNGYLR
jgi:hypothetical protein